MTLKFLRWLIEIVIYKIVDALMDLAGYLWDVYGKIELRNYEAEQSIARDEHR